MDIEQLVQVEVSSEDSDYPVDAALVSGSGRGWRASAPGEQVIRLLFDEPLKLTSIRLLFVEDANERTQEFVLRWSPDGGASWREIVRQQYHFSPPDTARELEDYRVNLDSVNTLELRIIPEISGGRFASLEQLRLA